ncbi:MAG TPA: BTAD domain-containing putative transcriptional regulator [Abditibacteriaceae bacterium]|nr:BTAD domain-containing putative transcriptional regulator [Abditibacteriaceae bacterium]
MNTQWRIELFGGLRAIHGGRVITRFRTHKMAVLLAYLAYHIHQSHPREVLIALLWPHCAPDVGRANLRTALASLRRQLEPPGVAAGSILMKTRHSVALNPAAVTTDVAEFKTALRSAAGAARAQLLSDAVELYRGDFLPGYYEDWILTEQRHLQELFFQATDQLVHDFAQAGAFHRAIQYAQRAVGVDPLREATRHHLMRLYAAQGQPVAALREYQGFKQILKAQFDSEPGGAMRALAQGIEAQIAQEVHPSSAQPSSAVPDARIQQNRRGSTATVTVTATAPCDTTSLPTGIPRCWPSIVNYCAQPLRHMTATNLVIMAIRSVLIFP